MNSRIWNYNMKLQSKAGFKMMQPWGVSIYFLGDRINLKYWKLLKILFWYAKHSTDQEAIYWFRPFRCTKMNELVPFLLNGFTKLILKKMYCLQYDRCCGTKKGWEMYGVICFHLQKKQLHWKSIWRKLK